MERISDNEIHCHIPIEENENPISQTYIRSIILMDTEPVLRNLKITQAYFDLSQAIAQRLGDVNANWCNFATWASKTAGRFIRMEDLNVHLHKLLHEHGDYNDWLGMIQDKFKDLEIDCTYDHSEIHHAAHNVIAEISADIAAGNLKVFSELGPVFSAMIEAFDKPLEEEKVAIETLLAGLTPGDTESGGQDMLANAIRDFYAAKHETDKKRTAELILRANAQTGLHEQVRLQPYIAAAMEAPVHHNFMIAIHKDAKEKTPEHKHHLLHGAFNHLFQPIAEKTHDAWLKMSTHYLMTLVLPDGIIHLGKDLPCPKDGPLFPEHLSEPHDEELTMLLKKYEAHLNTPVRSHAGNWAVLEDRMHFILNLFRSRQQHRPLHESPFDPEQEDKIRQNTIPSGKL
jgi:hypothetical protein